MITKGQLRLLQIVQRDSGIAFKVKKFSNIEKSVVLESVRTKVTQTVCIAVEMLLSAINTENGAWYTEKLA